MKFIFIFIFLTLVVKLCHAQEDNHWFFGYNAGIDFTDLSNPRTTNVGQTRQEEGVATISDQQGRLLFYTDGVSVWNRNHQIMSGGTGLKGHNTSTQSALIIPFPGSRTWYYIFTTDFQYGNAGLSYSTVNIDLDAGLGEVVQKNIPLLQPASEKVAAITHCNGEDVWVMTHGRQNDLIYAFLINRAGINLPVVNHTGRILPLVAISNIGYMKFSPDGSKLAVAHYSSGVDLFDFDDQTGIVSNRKPILDIPNLNVFTDQWPYGIEFSPNSKLLYLTNSIPDAGWNTFRNSLTQFNHLDSPVTIIQMSKIELDIGYPSFTNQSFLSAIQTGPDNKIYIARNSTTYLARINNPDVPGIACNYQRDGILLQAGTSSRMGLPGFNQAHFGNSFNSQVNCNSNTVSFFYSRSEKVRSVKWEFDDPVSGTANFSTLDSPLHQFSGTGEYHVKLVTFLSCRNDTISSKIKIDPVTADLGPDFVICTDSLFRLDPHSGTDRIYRWNNNSTNPTIQEKIPGLYWVEVSRPDGSCKTRDSILVSTKPNPVVKLGRDSLLCENNTLELDATNPGATYNWQDNSSAPVFTARKAGRYYVTVNLNGCLATDTIVVSTKYLPRVYMVSEAGICPGMDIQLTPVYQYTDNASYLWSNGSNESFTMANTTGQYRVDVSNECGTNSATIRLYNGACKLFVPTAFTPNGDGKNDLFKAEFGENVIKFQLEVFNRWGQRVFNSKEIRKGWDGRVNGVLQPSGVYAWKITYTLYNEPSVKIMKGTTTLIN